LLLAAVSPKFESSANQFTLEVRELPRSNE
jgi:hypothetical protein